MVWLPKKEEIRNKQAQKFMQHRFEFDNQHKDTYDDWIEAFKKAVDKCGEDGCFTGVSSGYDSGALSWELTQQDIEFKAWSILSTENKDIIDQRGKYIKNHEKVKMSRKNYLKYKDLLSARLDDVNYRIKRNGKIRRESILSDKASMGLAWMCDVAKKEGRTVYLSTQGADEIISDYALYPHQSSFKGTFPDKGEEWYNFKDGCNYSYIQKETRVPALFDVETRFPFLDIDLVQEFLWLTPELKNKNYKAPLYEYLTTNDIPFEKDKKTGFDPRDFAN